MLSIFDPSLFFFFFLFFSFFFSFFFFLFTLNSFQAIARHQYAGEAALQQEAAPPAMPSDTSSAVFRTRTDSSTSQQAAVRRPVSSLMQSPLQHMQSSRDSDIPVDASQGVHYARCMVLFGISKASLGHQT